ncbi:FAD-binding oxidoreductase [Iamia sp.]|uniref:FAD-binding oxidoreductase n=1 Tax=Iamia sp. TaxID=2722710 RepID=UPI002B7FF9A6|nr:FAD-linked oxidase C-terminal domain-containing protein [Iamia sp.]HXH57776.1 FAD-linked oxidase C-terminal domain-containing protein [Iamia sp.]
MADTTVRPDLIDALVAAVGDAHVTTGAGIAADDTHDEALTATSVTPLAVVRPATTAEVAAVLRAADEARVPVTARGSGTGLSGAAVPIEGGIVVAFDRMAAIVEIDTENHMAVVQPGVTLAQLDEAVAAHGLVYPVFPGELSASVGGNVATNAGGMRAVRYGVTRHHVLGLEAVLPSGEVMRTGGKVVKATSGYDLTQLLIGSEGTLALVTEATLKLHPRLAHSATVLAPFATLDQVTTVVPAVVRSGVGPMILEYIDLITMAAATAYVGLDLGIPQQIKDSALAYLVVVVEGRTAERVEEDTALVAEMMGAAGALDVYVLPPAAGAGLIDAREKAFWVAKANGADDIVDVVVPRASIPEYLARVSEIAGASGSWIAGCGHAGDGNVHLSVFQADANLRRGVLRDVVAAGLALGGAISGEHGIGTEKQHLFLELTDPVNVAVMRRIKAAFDPHGILNPGTLLD